VVFAGDEGVFEGEETNVGIEQYALNEASFVLAKMLQRYDRIEALDRGKIRKSLTLTLAPAGGVKIKLHRAAS